jgi:CDP-diglyceride synthetase
MPNILELLFLILPVVIAGILNMIFVKSQFLNILLEPLDNGLNLRDGKRVFGDNKTWKGFFGMIFLTAITMAVFQGLAIKFTCMNNFFLFPYKQWQFPFEGLIYGMILGFGYVFAELPNSFIKRRIGIDPGTNTTGVKGLLFILVDQADSVIGCLIFMQFFYPTSLVETITLVVLATIIHLLTNFALFKIGLKNQPV